MTTTRKRRIYSNTNTTNSEDSVIKIPNLNPVTTSRKLTREFFDVPCYNLANHLLGKILVRKLSDCTILKGRIIETECYLGGEDKASHSYQGRKTPGNEPMFMEPGTATEPGAAVLLRAVDPIQGVQKIRELRLKKRKVKSTTAKELKENELCNGPSKLCMSMDIEKNNCNKQDLCESEVLWVETDPNYDSNFKTVVTSRIGINSAGEEWANKPLRFYILGNSSISKRDRKAEKLIESDGG